MAKNVPSPRAFVSVFSFAIISFAKPDVSRRQLGVAAEQAALFGAARSPQTVARPTLCCFPYSLLACSQHVYACRLAHVRLET